LAYNDPSKPSYWTAAAGTNDFIVENFLSANPSVLSQYRANRWDKATLMKMYKESYVFSAIPYWYCEFNLDAAKTAGFNTAAAWISSSSTLTFCKQPAFFEDPKGTWNVPRIPPSIKDRCDRCQASFVGHANACAANDCAGNTPAQGVWYTVDQCGRCVCAKSTLGGCNSAPNKPPAQASGSCVADCGGNYYLAPGATSVNMIDTCGNCVVRATHTLGSERDDCNVCKNSNGYDAGNCQLDCMNFWYLVDKQVVAAIPDTPYSSSWTYAIFDAATRSDLTVVIGDAPARVDSCQVCILSREFAAYADDSSYYQCGVCKAPITGPYKGVVASGNAPDFNRDVDDQGIACPCGVGIQYCSSNGKETCDFENRTIANSTQFELVINCEPTCAQLGNGGPADECGLCSNDPRYQKSTDSCGLCCGQIGGVNLQCDLALDSCGVCFGGDASKDNACQACETDENPCIIGCDDKPCLENACPQFDCQGVCGGNSECTTCGDGVTDEGESCDLGPDNGVADADGNIQCPTDCILADNNSSSTIGAVIGSLLALLCLGASAFFAYKYAVKNGLLGKATGEVDMGAANANPLYDSATQIRSNPLYGEK